MRVFRSTSACLTLLGRLTAWSGVALVGLLTWLAVDPAAHAWFHGHAGNQAHERACASHSDSDHDDHDSDSPWADGHRCVITNFAHGHVELFVDGFTVSETIARLVAMTIPSAPELARVDLALPPGCGPPMA